MVKILLISQKDKRTFVMTKTKKEKFSKGREGMFSKMWKESVFGQLFRLTFFGHDKVN